MLDYRAVHCQFDGVGPVMATGHNNGTGLTPSPSLFAFFAYLHLIAQSADVRCPLPWAHNLQSPALRLSRPL